MGVGGHITNSAGGGRGAAEFVQRMCSVCAAYIQRTCSVCAAYV